jgi:hypothetical protein
MYGHFANAARDRLSHGVLFVSLNAKLLLTKSRGRRTPADARWIRVEYGEFDLLGTKPGARATPLEAADRLAIRLETARKRVKMVFQKTDTPSSIRLIRLALISTLPTISID